MKTHARNMVMMLVLAVALLWPELALAQEADKPMQVVGYGLVELLGYGLVLVVTALVSKLVLAIEKRYKVDVPDPWEAMLFTWIDRGIDYAEEQGRKAVNKVDGKVSPAIPDKLEVAASFVITALGGDKKLVAKGKEWLKRLIEARLQAKRKAETPTNLALIGNTIGSGTKVATASMNRPAIEMHSGKQLHGKNVVRVTHDGSLTDSYFVLFDDGTTGHFTGRELTAAGVV